MAPPKKLSRLSQHSKPSVYGILFWAYSAYCRGRQLLNSAKLLKDIDPGSAIGLAILAIEEFAKPWILFEYMASNQTQERWHETKEALESHEPKLELIIGSLKVLAFIKTPKEERHRLKSLNWRYWNGASLKILRENIMYTSMSDGEPVFPDRLVKCDQVKSFLEIGAYVEKSYQSVISAVEDGLPDLLSALQNCMDADDEAFGSLWNQYLLIAKDYEGMLKILSKSGDLRLRKELRAAIKENKIRGFVVRHKPTGFVLDN